MSDSLMEQHDGLKKITLLARKKMASKERKAEVVLHGVEDYGRGLKGPKK